MIFPEKTSWHSILQQEFTKPYYKKLENFIKSEKEKNICIYPPENKIFSAFTQTDFDAVRVVILGQDPYHQENQAHGMSFSIPENQKKIPPSLRNIFKEVSSCGYKSEIKNGNLSRWANQGVLLLNSILTVEANKARSHQKKGWEEFTDQVIKKISHNKNGIIFLLWGSHAQSKASLIDRSKHTILMSSHPSPLSSYKGFLGCEHFTITNKILQTNNSSIIRW